jgi:hypothetical protein
MKMSVMRKLGWVATTLTICALVGCSGDRASLNNDEALLKLKEQCRAAGAKTRAEWTAKYPTETFSDSPEYAYSPRLKTCLYADEYTDVDDGSPAYAFLQGVKSRRDRFVVDVYTNKVLLEYTEHDGRSITTESDPVMCRSEKEFEQRRASLFEVIAGTR